MIIIDDHIDEDIVDPASEAGAEEAAPEEAPDPLNDRTGAFAAYTLAADLLKLREIYDGYLQRIPNEAWQRSTERRAIGWNLLELLAHLEATSHAFNTSVEQALAGEPVTLPKMTTRSDLRAANRAAIDERLHLGPAEIGESFLASLSHAARLAASLSPDQLATSVEHPYFGRQPTIAEILGSSLVHAGIVHGAQIAVGARTQTIWNFYDPGLTRRQLTRAFHTLGLSYWPERGGDLHTTVAFHIEGQGGGSWFVRIEPQGAKGDIGTVRTADVTLTFTKADIFCRVVTLQANLWRYVFLRKLRIKGNLRLTARLSHFFIPT